MYHAGFDGTKKMNTFSGVFLPILNGVMNITISNYDMLEYNDLLHPPKFNFFIIFGNMINHINCFPLEGEGPHLQHVPFPVKVLPTASRYILN